ncbi:MAG: bifunctional DNA primase/polymerase, partial [Dehalococcoidia bacterium]
KKPLTEQGFLDASVDPEQIDRWWRRWPSAHIGVATGIAHLCVIDLDFDPVKGKNGQANFAKLCSEMGSHECALIASTPRGGQHYFYRMPQAVLTSRVDILEKGSGIDVRASGGYVIVPSPSSPGREWLLGDLSDVGPLPEWLVKILTPARSREGSRKRINSASDIPLQPETKESIRRALDYIDPNPREEWICVGMGLKSTGAGEAAYDLWYEWSSKSPKFDERVQRDQWDSLGEYLANAGEITIATIFWMAAKGGMPAGSTPSEDGIETMTVAKQTMARIPKTEIRAIVDGDGDGDILEQEPFPTHLLNCPGLVGDLARWILETSPQPQPALALASSIATVGAILGRRVKTETNLRTNIYALGIGETGCGKNPGIRRPVTLLAHAGLERMIGPGEWKSDSGLRTAIRERPSQVCFIDEFVKVLATMSGDRVPAYIAGIKRALLELFSCAADTWLATAYANNTLHPAEPLHEPHLCVYGVGTPADFFSVVDHVAVSDGFLNRFLCFFVDDHLPRRVRPATFEGAPAALVEQVRAIEDRTAPEGNLEGLSHSMAFRSGAKLVPFLKRAQDLIWKVEAENDERIRAMQARKNPLASLWGRFSEHVQKLALLRAASDDRTREISELDVAWAVELVGWCQRRVHVLARAHLAGSRVEADLKRVLRVIEGEGAAGVTSSTLTRRTQWLRRSERKDVLATLAESGQIVVDVEQRDSGRAPIVYRSTRFVAAHTASEDAEPIDVAPQSAVDTSPQESAS